MKRIITKYDIVLICIIVIVSIISIVGLFFRHNEDGDIYVKIYYKEKIYDEYKLTKDLDKEVIINGDKYHNTVVIKDGQVYVRNANCPDKICEKHLPISKPGEMIVCLPNKLVIRIEGSKKLDNNLDSISQ